MVTPVRISAVTYTPCRQLPQRNLIIHKKIDAAAQEEQDHSVSVKGDDVRESETGGQDGEAGSGGESRRERRGKRSKKGQKVLFLPNIVFEKQGKYLSVR